MDDNTGAGCAASSPTRTESVRRNGTFSLIASCATLVTLALTLAGCGGDDSSEPTPTVVATATAEVDGTANLGTPAGGDAPQALVGDVVWATSIDPQTKAPLDQVDRYAVDAPAIYAVIPVTRVAPDTELTAEWSYNDTAIEGVGASAVVSTQLEEPVWVEFHLQRSTDAPWPDGTYAVRIRQNDQVVAERAVEVGDPPR